MQNKKSSNTKIDIFYCGKLGKTIINNKNIYHIDISRQLEAKKKGWGLIYI
jgi:hypothetical protein